MKGFTLLAGALLLMAGCANIPKTVTYQATEWRQVEEPQPALQRIVTEGVEEEIEVAQPPKTVVVQADIPKVFPGAKKGRKYLNIGWRPVNANRQLVGKEVEFILPFDMYVRTIDFDGRRSSNYLIAGKRVVGSPAPEKPGYYRAMWIRECGNPILNEDAIAIYIKVREEIVPQPPIKVKRPKTQLRVEIVPQPPIKRWVEVPVTKTRELTCRERKAEVGWLRKGLSYVVTGVVGTGGALIGGKVGGPYGTKIGAGIGVFAGRLIGGYTDGTECIDGGDTTEAVVLGVTAGMIAPKNATPSSASGGGHTMPGNGSGGHTIPGNGGGFTPTPNPVTGHTLPIN